MDPVLSFVVLFISNNGFSVVEELNIIEGVSTVMDVPALKAISSLALISIPPADAFISIAAASVPIVFVITICSLVPPFVVIVNAVAVLLVVSIAISPVASMSNADVVIASSVSATKSN